MHAGAKACVDYISGTKMDDRFIRVEMDAGFTEGRQYGRGQSGGQVRDETRTDYDAGRGGYGMERARDMEILNAASFPSQHRRPEDGGGMDMEADVIGAGEDADAGVDAGNGEEGGDEGAGGGRDGDANQEVSDLSAHTKDLCAVRHPSVAVTLTLHSLLFVVSL